MFRFAADPSSQTNVTRLAAERLRESSHRSLWAVACDYRTGVLTLTGRVASYHVKQLAQTIVGKIDGVERVVNRLEVPELKPAVESGVGRGRPQNVRPR